jgi:hypothetical protein
MAMTRTMSLYEKTFLLLVQINFHIPAQALLQVWKLLNDLIFVQHHSIKATMLTTMANRCLSVRVVPSDISHIPAAADDGRCM